MKPSTLLLSGVPLAIMLVAPAASAHIALMSPPPRSADLKDGPCGVATGDKRGAATTFKPGQTITVKWKETIGHPGHFRISFDDDGQDGFVDPKSFDDLNTAPTVLVDNIKDKTGTQVYEQEVTLPNVECDTCTLQVIQVMTDKPPYGDGNDLYYQCADITLSNAATTAEEDAGSTSSSSSGTTPPTTPAPAADSGCHTSGAPTGSTEAVLLALATVAGLGAARRRRARS